MLSLLFFQGRVHLRKVLFAAITGIKQYGATVSTAPMSTPSAKPCKRLFVISAESSLCRLLPGHYLSSACSSAASISVISAAPIAANVAPCIQCLDALDARFKRPKLIVVGLTVLYHSMDDRAGAQGTANALA
jgi:hypothetical protein